MANNKTQEFHYYDTAHNSYQIMMSPLEQTLRCPDTYSQHINVWNIMGEGVWEDTFDTDEIFWSAVDTQEKMLTYIKRVINNMENSL